MQFQSVHEISAGGERVSQLNPDATYFAHLSIYDFAAPFCRDGLVLDAGSGAGYGSAYLLEHGAREVWGIDSSPKAVAFSRHHFSRPKLAFMEMDLEQIEGFEEHSLDVIFSSNTLEHVPNVSSFFRQAWRLIKPGGTLVLAVPPVTDDRLVYLNLINPYHVNIWTPRQWENSLDVFFEEVTPVLHGVERIGCDFRRNHVAHLSEKSFVFQAGETADMYRQFTLTAIFVAGKPRSEPLLPTGAPLPLVDESFTRAPGYIDPSLRLKLDKYFSMRTPPHVRLIGSARRGFAFLSRALRQRQ
jgi:SAM-dependent methyltransferase